MIKSSSFAIQFAVPLLLAIAFGTKSAAQARPVPTINQQKKHEIKSKINGHVYPVFVSLPKNYSKTDTVHYPVFYILDGNSGFPVAHAARQMLDLVGAIEDIIIVGIGYEWDKSYQPWFTTRWNDLTPTADTKADTSQQYLGALSLPKGSLNSGGTERFITILKTEIISFVQKEYKANEDRGLYGHSLGGLFAAYCLLKEPGLFRRYAISSPSVWWDNRKILDIEKSFSANNQGLNAQVFLSVGSLEGDMMVSGMNALGDALKSHSYNGLSLTTQVFDGETHFSVFSSSVSKAIRVLYPVKRK